MESTAWQVWQEAHSAILKEGAFSSWQGAKGVQARAWPRRVSGLRSVQLKCTPGGSVEAGGSLSQ